MTHAILSILLLSKSAEPIVVGLIVGAITIVIVLIFSALKKAAKNVGKKSKEARKNNTDSGLIE